MPEEYAIELRGVKKAWGDVVAVRGFDVQIRKGEFFSLLGPSGCGKTTTLRMIAGLEEPTDGRDPPGGPRREPCAAVPAERAHRVPGLRPVPAHDGAQEHLVSAQDARRISRRRPAADRPGPAARQHGRLRAAPAPAAFRRASGRGSRWRASLVDEPAALLLDEPLGALDFKLRGAMQKVLKDIQRNVGITFIYVTHDQTEALTMSDRIAVMKGGRVHQIGTPGRDLQLARHRLRRLVHRGDELPPRPVAPADGQGARARSWAATRCARPASTLPGRPPRRRTSWSASAPRGYR